MPLQITIPAGSDVFPGHRIVRKPGLPPLTPSNAGVKSSQPSGKFPRHFSATGHYLFTHLNCAHREELPLAGHRTPAFGARRRGTRWLGRPQVERTMPKRATRRAQPGLGKQKGVWTAAAGDAPRAGRAAGRNPVRCASLARACPMPAAARMAGAWLIDPPRLRAAGTTLGARPAWRCRRPPSSQAEICPPARP